MLKLQASVICNTANPQGFINCPASTARQQHQYPGEVCLHTASLTLGNLEKERVLQTKGRPAVNNQPLHSRNPTDHPGCSPCPTTPSSRWRSGSTFGAAANSLLPCSLRNLHPQADAFPLGSRPLFLPGRCLLTLAQPLLFPREHLWEPVRPMAALVEGRRAFLRLTVALAAPFSSGLGQKTSPQQHWALPARLACRHRRPSHEPALAPRWKGQDLSGTGRGSRSQAGKDRGSWLHPGMATPGMPGTEPALRSCERSRSGSTWDILSGRTYSPGLKSARLLRCTDSVLQTAEADCARALRWRIARR